jgi:hypothetical protein
MVSMPVIRRTDQQSRTPLNAARRIIKTERADKA